MKIKEGYGGPVIHLPSGKQVFCVHPIRGGWNVTEFGDVAESDLEITQACVDYLVARWDPYYDYVDGDHAYWCKHSAIHSSIALAEDAIREAGKSIPAAA